MEEEKEYFKNFLAKKRLRVSSRRTLILETFLKEEGHISAQEIFNKVAKKDPSIGISTVYRSINLFQEAGLAQRRQFGDGEARYEHKYFHQHHDHLICERCGKIAEFESHDIESLQVSIAKQHNFEISSHRLELYGVCSECQKKQ